MGSSTPLDNVSAGKKLLEYSKLEQKACLARYTDAFKFYTSDHTLGPNKVGCTAMVARLIVWRLSLGALAADSTDSHCYFPTVSGTRWAREM